MSIRHLDSLFDPASVAVIGASERPGSVGATVWRNLREGGFAGQLMAVNPKHATLGGERAYANVASLPQVPELAVICTPPATVPKLIDELGRRGCHAAVVLTAGLDKTQKLALLDAARPHLLRVLGPNGLGLLNPHRGLNASFAHIGAAKGSLAFVSQSGSLVTAMLDWAAGRGIGFSLLASLGEHADVDFGDMLDYLACDANTRAILLYIESIEAPRKFMSAARAAARNKPVLVVKTGRSPQGQRAAASHMGALASTDMVVDAAIRRAGMLRVDSLQELFVAAEALSHERRTLTGRPERLTLLTNGGGAGVLAADAAAAAGVPLAELAPSTLAALDAVLPPNWSHGNPVDLIGDAPVQRYVDAVQVLQAAPEAGSLLFMHAPTAIVPSADIAQALLPLLRGSTLQPLACWLGDGAVREARGLFQRNDIATYDTPEQAVQAFSMLLTYRRNQEQLMEAPAAAPVPPLWQAAAVHSPIDLALAAGREWLSESEAKAVLAACGIAVACTRVVAPTAAAALAAAAQVGFPVALKIVSPQISHKSDVGGVALDLEHAAALQAAAEAMLSRVRALQPQAEITGFSVQAMVRRPRALELIVGASIDPLFGPVILFGAGGTAVEVVADRAVALPPLNAPLARALVQRTRIARLLAGWRDVPAADLDAVLRVLTTVSQLLAEEPRITEIDINSLLADAAGVIALDARIRVSAAAPGGAEHFAIRPYPAQLSERVDWQGRPLTLRPIRPEDEAQHLAFLGRLDPEDVRMRIFYSRRSIEHSELARLTQIDFEREMAFIATTEKPEGGEETLAVARAIADPDNIDAEFGIVVRSDLKGGGLGELLLNKLIAYLRQRGTQRLVATVLVENARMLELARELGFEFDAEQPEHDTRRIALAL